MSDAVRPADGGRWHQALVLAVTGQHEPDLDRQGSPDPDALARELLARDGAVALRRHRQAVLDSGRTWPHPVPAELMAGLGYAQFTAALTLLVQQLGLEDRGAVGRTSAAAAPGPIEPALRRLLDDVPPHHGG